MNSIFAAFKPVATLLVFAGACLVVADVPSRGEDPPRTPAPVPVPVPVPATAAVPTLTLVDGGVLPGVLKDNDRAGFVRWQATPFASPFEFAWNNLQSIRFPLVDGTPRPLGAFGFELTGGDVLYGSLLGLDEKAAEIEVARLGKLRVDRSRIQRIFRWRDGASLLYNGPNGLKGWKEFTPVKPKPANPNPGMIVFGRNGAAAPEKAPEKVEPPTPRWREEGGQLVTSREEASLRGDVGLTSKASVALEFSWTQTPNFQVAIGVADSDDDKAAAEAIRLEVWDNQLVVIREVGDLADVASLQPVGEGPGRAQLQLFIDLEAGKVQVFSAIGALLGELNLKGKPGPADSWLRLTSNRGDFRLERLRVGRWDGETPRPSVDNESRVPMADGSSVRGKVDRLDAEKHEFVVKDEDRESRIAQDQLASAVLTQARDEKPRSIRAIYQDGSRIGGEWVKLEGGMLVLNVLGFAEPLRLPIDGMRSLEVVGQDLPSPPKEDLIGTLEMDGLRLKGKLSTEADPSGGSRLAWLPIGSETASPFKPGASGKVVYRTPAPKPSTTTAQPQPPRQQGIGVMFNALSQALDRNAPASTPMASPGKTLYLRTGDIIPSEITRIEEAGVTFKTPLSDRTFVPNAKIKAVELATETGTTVKVNKLKRERLLTLPRMQKDSPPTHLIRSKNGDILRGRVIAMDNATVRVEVRLEEKEIPRDRVSRIVWLHADETDPTKKVVEPPAVAGPMRVQAVRSDGIRLTFDADRVGDGTVFGKSEVLGDCKVPLKDLDQLLIGGSVEKEATQLAYQNWKLQNAPEPRAAQEGEGSGGGTNGTEAALVGKPAPDFTLELIGGKKFHLAENKGKVIVLDFWATWCGPCLQAMPQIDKVTHEFADKGVQLIAVNLQEAPAKITSMLERQKLNPTVALDTDGRVAEKYGANAIPQTVVIDQEGKVTRLFIGGGPHLGDQLREALQALMPPETGKPATQ